MSYDWKMSSTGQMADIDTMPADTIIGVRVGDYRELLAQIEQMRAVVRDAVAAIRAREEAPGASVFTWEYIIACVLDDETEAVSEAASEPIDRWSINAIRKLIALAAAPAGESEA